MTYTQKLQRVILAAALALTNASAFSQRIPQSQIDYDVNRAVADASRYYHVDQKLIRAVIKTESNYNIFAVSHAGALGVMQLLPSTAWGLGVRDPFNPRQNIFGGTLYLRQMLDRYHDTNLALAAYNAGVRAVDRHGGIPPYRETIGYINHISSLYAAQQFGQIEALISQQQSATTLGTHAPQ